MKNRTFGILSWFILVPFLFVMCTPAPKPTDLFNGKDLTGWVAYTDPLDSADNSQVFSVKDSVIHITGVPVGYLRTEQVYADYTFHAEWRWVEAPANSGLFQRIQMPDQKLPKSIEVQLMAGSAGDFVMLSGSKIAGLSAEEAAKAFPMQRKMQASNEKPAGEWNTADITCKGDSIIVYINGVLQNKAGGAPASGYIGLQSEGGPIEFRNLNITFLNQ
ncbi:MAG: DUF1080 domain-containing protein [Bacteroidales bacterium]|nr:DUF1080 domain-containing protein [Bacteroidales bacterium]